jgi:predicted alpha/beta superfamily hydrolase
MFSLQSKLMREAAKAFLSSERCSNSSEAYHEYLLGLGKSCGGWFFEEALWMAVYGTSCRIIISSSSWRRAAAAERQQRQQQREQARQQRKRARWQQQREQARQQRERARWQQQDERARQQHRQQQYQQARQQGVGMQAALADLSAAEPDVTSMSEEQLRAFLETVSSTGRHQLYT